MRLKKKVLSTAALIAGILGGISYGLGLSGRPIAAQPAPNEDKREAAPSDSHLPRLLELKLNADGKVKIPVYQTSMSGGHLSGIPEQVELDKLKDLTVTTVGGKEISKEDALKRLGLGGLVVISTDGMKIPPAYLKVFKDEVLVLVSPDLVVRGVGVGLAKDPSGPGGTSSERRSRRWIITFKTSNGQDYFRQLAAMSAGRISQLVVHRE